MARRQGVMMGKGELWGGKAGLGREEAWTIATKGWGDNNARRMSRG